jgi:DNA-binding NarL/FixJ family response regulator
VLARRRTANIEALLPRVYGAALAASADAADAAHLTGRVLAAAAAGSAHADGRALVERALLGAVRSAPHPAFAAMPLEQREVLVLARLGGYKVPEIAEALGLADSCVRSLMLSALRATTVAVTSDAAPRMRPPPRGCGSAASPARAARAS